MKSKMSWEWHTEGVIMKEEVRGKACDLAWNVVAWVRFRGVAYEGGGEWRGKSFCFSEQNRELLECFKERMTWLIYRRHRSDYFVKYRLKVVCKGRKKTKQERNDSGSDQGSSSGVSANRSDPRFAESVGGGCEIEKRQELLWRFVLE